MYSVLQLLGRLDRHKLYPIYRSSCIDAAVSDDADQFDGTNLEHDVSDVVIRIAAVVCIAVYRCYARQLVAEHNDPVCVGLCSYLICVPRT